MLYVLMMIYIFILGIKCFFLGFCACLLVATLESQIRFCLLPEGHYLSGDFFHQFMFVGIPEEACKLLFVILLLWGTRILFDWRSAMTFVGLIGIGFGICEAWIHTCGMATGISFEFIWQPFIHFCFGWVMGLSLYLIRIKYDKRWNEWIGIILVLIFIAGLHAFYNVLVR